MIQNFYQISITIPMLFILQINYKMLLVITQKTWVIIQIKN